MRILDRYLLREFLAPSAICLVAFSLLFVVFDLFDRLGRFLNVEAPLSSIAVYYFHYLFAFNGNTSLIVAILPISMLLGALYCASRMIRYNEFVAMMAGGVSFVRILLPFLTVGVVASFLCLAAQEFQAPRSMRWMLYFEQGVLKRNAAPDLIRNFLYLNAAERRLWDIRQFSPTNAFSYGAVTVTQFNPDRSETVYFTGQAHFADGTWWLRSPRIEHRNPDGAILGEPEFFPKRALEMRNWTETPRDFVIERVAQTDWQSLSARDIRTYLNNHPDFPGDKRARIATDYACRLSGPFTCLVVALLGMPVGLKTGRHNVMSRIILTFAFFFLFYMSLEISLYLGKTQVLPPVLAAWLPNILFSGIGVGMIVRLH